MGRFRSPESQSKFAVRNKLAIGKPSHSKRGGDGRIHSLGTARTYSDSLKCVATYIADQKLDTCGKGLSSLSPETAMIYLESRAQEVGQKQLDKDRQAMQMLLGEKLAVVKSELDEVMSSRAYTQQQIQMIVEAQSKEHALATLVAADGGLRAHELLTLLPVEERRPSGHRSWSGERFEGRCEVTRFTVQGKGGLVREIAIRKVLTDQLTKLRLSEPRVVTDRDIFYVQHYDIGGGHRWSDSFSKASKRELGWSNGAHGVRHTYAQMRMRSLQLVGFNYEQALGIVSQEMGHFRQDITEVYLR
jgi:integrase